MAITYEILTNDNIDILRDLCNELMTFQKTKAYITPERFDSMSFETRLIPSVSSSLENYFIIAKDGDQVVGYAYSNISDKRVYESGQFGKFFDMDSIDVDNVGCLSQFYIREAYRGMGIGSGLFNQSMAWISGYEHINDVFIFVSNGNYDALEFYKSKGFNVSHDILSGFITVLRNI